MGLGLGLGLSSLPLHALEGACPAGVGVGDARVREEALQARLVRGRVMVQVKVKM